MRVSSDSTYSHGSPAAAAGASLVDHWVQGA